VGVAEFFPKDTSPWRGLPRFPAVHILLKVCPHSVRGDSCARIGSYIWRLNHDCCRHRKGNKSV
jgi:hypothetical protein